MQARNESLSSSLKQIKISTVPVSELSKKEHGALLCYPGVELKSFDSRVKQLKKLGVSELILEGSSKIGKFGIAGKGCVSVVVRARLETEKEPVALKIRRTDANRSDMKRDHELQRIANSVGVGPRSIGVTKDLFAMEYVNGQKLGSWTQTLNSHTSKRFTRGLIRSVLKQCYQLDSTGLDHGELSNPTKHVLVSGDFRKPQAAIIDYESASVERRVSNLTAVAQFFLLGGWQSEKIRKIIGLDDHSKKELITLLRIYKEDPSEESVEELLDYVEC